MTNLAKSSAQDLSRPTEEATNSSNTKELVKDVTPTTSLTTDREMSHEPTYVTGNFINPYYHK